MKELLFRLGQVIWWLGAAGIFFGMLGLVGLALVPDDGGAIGPSLTVCALGAACWIVAYVLTGSFWRAPRLP